MPPEVRVWDSTVLPHPICFESYHLNYPLDFLLEILLFFGCVDLFLRIFSFRKSFRCQYQNVLFEIISKKTRLEIA